MGKYLVVLIAMLFVAIGGMAKASVQVKDYPCDAYHTISRMVGFYDDNQPSSGPYYYYILYCDGRMFDYWYEDFGEEGYLIGSLPSWATPWYATGNPVQNSSGVWADDILSGGHLAAQITWDGVLGHHAVMTTYNAPLE